MKKKKGLPWIQMLNAEGTVLFSGESMELVFPEALILKMSVRFFSDPAPCFIHRSAVIIRLQEEICALLTEAGKTGRAALEISKLDPEIQAYFGAYPGAALVSMEDEGSV